MAYDAFISYSHSADGKLAPALQAGVHRFAKPWWKLRAANVFRDGTSLAAAYDLSGAIKTALTDSRFFIFLASPRAAGSKWCQREIDYWIAERPLENLLIVLTEGSILWDEGARDFDWRVTDALPRSLAGVFKAEPLWLDLSWARTGDHISTADPRFQHCVAMLAARLHNKSLDEIAGEDVRQHKRTRRAARAAIAGLVLLTVSSVAGAWYAVEGQRRAERNLEQALAATDTMVGDVAEGMRNFYGVPRERLAGVLGRVEGILNALAAMEPSDAIVERRAAMMRTLTRANIDLGDLTRAGEIRDKSEALISPLAARNGPLSTASRTLASLQLEAFDIARRQSKYSEANARASRHRVLNDAMTAALTPDTASAVRSYVLQDRILVIERQRVAAVDQGRLDDALIYAREAVEAADKFLAAYPNDVTPQRLASIERAKLAEVLADLGRPDEALKDLDLARAKLMEIDRVQPNRLDTLWALVELETSRGQIFEDRNDWVAALVAYETCADVLVKLQAADPKNVALTADLASAHNKMANAATKLGQPDRAKSDFAAASGLFADALRAQPDNVDYARAASRNLQTEAAFLESRRDLAGARDRLDRAITISDTLVTQRGADEAGVLIAVAVRVVRARLANVEDDPKTAIRLLDRAELLLADLGRPAAPANLSRAVDIVVDMARQWGLAARLDRSLGLVEGALQLYAPPRDVSRAASTRYFASIAKLHLQKATVELDRGQFDAALATGEYAISLYETEVVAHSRADSSLNSFAQQIIQLGRIAGVARKPGRARDAYCSVAPKVTALAPDIPKRPRLWQTALEADYLCIEARYFGGDRDAQEKALAALAIRVDSQVPFDDDLQGEWRSLRARTAALRAGMRSIAGDSAGAIKLHRAAIEIAAEALKWPSATGEDHARIAFLRGQLADLLQSSGDSGAAITQAEGAVDAWRKTVQIDRVDYGKEIKLAGAMMELAGLVSDASKERALKLNVDAAGLLERLAARVPVQGRQATLEPWARALQGAGNGAYDLDHLDDALRWHKRALEVTIELSRLSGRNPETELDVGRQLGRNARVLVKADRFEEARQRATEARQLFAAHRDAAEDPAAVDRLIGWVDRLLSTTDKGQTSEEAARSSPEN